MGNFHFYIQPTDGKEKIGSLYDIEHSFPQTYYVSCKGLETLGNPKNIYTENYAEESGLRVYHPVMNKEKLTREATTIELTLLFRSRSVYNIFTTLILGGAEYPFLYYWDTARNKKVKCVAMEAVEPTSDIIKGVKYLIATFRFTNLWGEGKNCNNQGVTSDETESPDTPILPAPPVVDLTMMTKSELVDLINSTINSRFSVATQQDIDNMFTQELT